MGQALRDRDDRMFPLLYALAFFTVTDLEMEDLCLSYRDMTVIKKAQDHFGVIYRRFLKQQMGWKRGLGEAAHHQQHIALLKENVILGNKTPKHFQPKGEAGLAIQEQNELAQAQ